MKIAITSTGNSPDSTIDMRFGRCAYFVIYDNVSGSTEFIPNPNKEHVEGAGPASVQLVASKEVKKVVSGEFGGKVKSVFDSLQIQLIMLDDHEKTIAQIIELLNKQKYFSI